MPTTASKILEYMNRFSATDQFTAFNRQDPYATYAKQAMNRLGWRPEPISKPLPETYALPDMYEPRPTTEMYKPQPLPGARRLPGAQPLPEPQPLPESYGIPDMYEPQLDIYKPQPWLEPQPLPKKQQFNRKKAESIWGGIGSLTNQTQPMKSWI